MALALLSVHPLMLVSVAGGLLAALALTRQMLGADGSGGGRGLFQASANGGGSGGSGACGECGGGCG
ncbi:MAG: hypothetical protein ACK41W_08060 [Cyanobacteriota bacterium]